MQWNTHICTYYIGRHVIAKYGQQNSTSFFSETYPPPYNKYAKNICKQISVTISYNQEVIYTTEWTWKELIKLPKVRHDDSTPESLIIIIRRMPSTASFCRTSIETQLTLTAQLTHRELAYTCISVTALQLQVQTLGILSHHISI